MLEAAYDLTRRIYEDFEYAQGATSIATPLAEVMRVRRGVCQDFAHLEIAMLRSLGLPARYVSGYVRTRPAPGRQQLTGADASHAWAALYCPGFGYIDLDPTNGTIPHDEHVTLAWGRDFGDVSPVKGVILGGGRAITLRKGGQRRRRSGRHSRVDASGPMTALEAEFAGGAKLRSRRPGCRSPGGARKRTLVR